MALEDIFRALDEQADADCCALLEAAQAQASSISSEAVEVATTICANCVEGARSAGEEDASRKLNAARLEAQKRVASAKEDAVVSVFEASKSKLAALRGSSDYPLLFRALLDEAISGLNGTPVVLVDPLDETLAISALRDLGVTGEVRPEISTMGGVIVSYSEGRIIRRNTLEDRLQKAIPFVKSEVAEILFS